MHQYYATEDYVGCQNDLICNVFFVIDNKANGKDAATGVVADAVLDDATDQTCHVSRDDDG